MRIPRGIRNNNPGNIRKTAAKWLGETEGEDDAFESFETAEMGIRALARVLLNYQRKWKKRTIRDIINRWAPPNENNSEAYIEAVCAECGVQADTWLDLEDTRRLKQMLVAIITHENGRQPYTDEQIETGMKLAYV